MGDEPSRRPYVGNNFWKGMINGFLLLVLMWVIAGLIYYLITI